MSMSVYPGYPKQRLVIPTGPIPDPLPSGAWNAGGRNPGGSWASDPILPTASESQQFIAQGYKVDRLGRPLHPHLEAMIRHDGVYTGRGAYWHWGSNLAVDPVVIAADSLLLIQRRDTGIWALPGGFRDHREPAALAGARELAEETGVKVNPAQARWLGHLVCCDLRTTAHAWAETDGFAWILSHQLDTVAGDDAQDSAWFSLDQLPDNLMSSHLELINRAKGLL
jgi:ADP-ribose pyrophosphatase